MWSPCVAATVAVALSFGGIVQPPAEPTNQPVVSASLEGEESESPESEGTGLGDALREEALERFIEGGRLFEDRRYLQAAASYERSYAAIPVGKTLYNVALSYEKGGDIVKSLDAYQRYLALPDCPAPQEHCADRRREVERTVSELRRKVGTLAIEVDRGVELRGIEIDDRFIPPEDFPLVLPPGRYTLRVRGVSRDQVRIRDVEVPAGQITSLLIPPFDAREPDQDSPPPPVVQPPDESDDLAARAAEAERRRRLRIAFYGGVGLTAAAGIATAITGGLTLRAHREFTDRCKGEGEDCTGETYPQDARDRFERTQPATNALIGVTAGLGLVTIVLGLYAFSARRTPGSRASVTRLHPTPGGVRLSF